MKLIATITMLSVMYFSPVQNQTKKEIKPLKGTAPYGVEKRPMPAGLNLEELLPKQVGSYTRTLLEESERRGVTASSIQVDGESVYATYKSGAKEIFVEFAVSNNAAAAPNRHSFRQQPTLSASFPLTRASARLALSRVICESTINPVRSMPGRVASIIFPSALKAASQISMRL